MKHSIIKEIFYGNRGSIHDITMPPEIRKEGLKNAEIIDEFSKSLSQEQKLALEEILDNEANRSGGAEEAFFVEAMKIGIRLGVEAFDD